VSVKRTYALQAIV